MFFSKAPTASGIDLWLSDWFVRNITGGVGPIEVEAKMGLLINKETGRRLELPVSTETLIADAPWLRFESDIPVSLHRYFNDALNRNVKTSGLAYKHELTVDKIYNNASDARTKTRFTFDEKTGKLLASVKKRRIGDVAIFFPNAPFDIRVSISEELSVAEAMPPSHPPSVERRKDRMTYRSLDETGFKIDLTQVMQTGETLPRHELELECTSADLLARDPGQVSLLMSAVRNMVFATVVKQ